MLLANSKIRLASVNKVCLLICLKYWCLVMAVETKPFLLLLAVVVQRWSAHSRR